MRKSLWIRRLRVISLIQMQEIRFFTKLNIRYFTLELLTIRDLNKQEYMSRILSFIFLEKCYFTECKDFN